VFLCGIFFFFFESSYSCQDGDGSYSTWLIFFYFFWLKFEFMRMQSWWACWWTLIIC